jgi:hypothetical protein
MRLRKYDATTIDWKSEVREGPSPPPPMAEHEAVWRESPVSWQTRQFGRNTIQQHLAYFLDVNVKRE